jgi:acylphosphatase
MKKCVKIIIKGISDNRYMQSVILPNARDCGVEGVCQKIDDQTMRIITTGSDLQIDSFLDLLHAKTALEKNVAMEVEAFLQQTDFRGVFRVIE